MGFLSAVADVLICPASNEPVILQVTLSELIDDSIDECLIGEYGLLCRSSSDSMTVRLGEWRGGKAIQSRWIHDGSDRCWEA